MNTEATTASDVGAEGGVPVMKNRLSSLARSTRVARHDVDCAADVPSRVARRRRRKRRTMSYAAKGTLQFAGGHRIDASFFGDPSHGENGPQRPSALLVTDTSSFSTLDYGGHQQTVRYGGILGTLADRSRLSGRSTRLASCRWWNDWRVTDRTVTPNITGGVGIYEAGNRASTISTQVKSTHIFKSHSVKYGSEYYDATYAQANQLTGPTFSAPDGRRPPPARDGRPSGRMWRAAGSTGSPVRTSIAGATHRKLPRCLRAGHWRVDSADDQSRPPIRTGDDERPIIKDFTLKNNWAPRIGATFDVTGDGKTKSTELRSLLRPHPERPRGARALGRRRLHAVGTTSTPR